MLPNPNQPIPQPVTPNPVPQFVDPAVEAPPQNVPQFEQPAEPQAGIGQELLQDGTDQPVDPQIDPYRQEMIQRQEQLYQQLIQQSQQNEQLQDYMAQQYILNSVQPEMRDTAWRIYQYNKQVQAQIKAAEQEKQKAIQFAQQADREYLPLLKERALTELSQKYGVEKELLRGMNSRQEAEVAARTLAAYKKKYAFQQRQAAQVDAVPQTSGQTNSGTDISDVYNKYRHKGRIAQVVQELRRRGQWD